MVKIAVDQFNRNGFVRNAMNVMKNVASEEQTLINSFKELYPHMETDITNVQIAPFNTFIKNVYDIDPNNHSNKKLVKIIYRLRNSIVHNKHTEFHFSYGNVEDYKDILPLIRLLIEKLELRAMTILNDHDIKIIDYEKPMLPLY